MLIIPVLCILCQRLCLMCVCVSAREQATVAWSVPMPVSLTGEYNNMFDLAIESNAIHFFLLKTSKREKKYEFHKNITFRLFLRFNSICYYTGIRFVSISDRSNCSNFQQNNNSSPQCLFATPFSLVFSTCSSVVRQNQATKKGSKRMKRKPEEIH